MITRGPPPPLKRFGPQTPAGRTADAMQDAAADRPPIERLPSDLLERILGCLRYEEAAGARAACRALREAAAATRWAAAAVPARGVAGFVGECASGRIGGFERLTLPADAGPAELAGTGEGWAAGRVGSVTIAGEARTLRGLLETVAAAVRAGMRVVSVAARAEEDFSERASLDAGGWRDVEVVSIACARRIPTAALLADRFPMARKVFAAGGDGRFDLGELAGMERLEKVTVACTGGPGGLFPGRKGPTVRLVGGVLPRRLAKLYLEVAADDSAGPDRIAAAAAASAPNLEKLSFGLLDLTSPLVRSGLLALRDLGKLSTVGFASRADQILADGVADVLRTSLGGKEEIRATIVFRTFGPSEDAARVAGAWLRVAPGRMRARLRTSTSFDWDPHHYQTLDPHAARAIVHRCRSEAQAVDLEVASSAVFLVDRPEVLAAYREICADAAALPAGSNVRLLFFDSRRMLTPTSLAERLPSRPGALTARVAHELACLYDSAWERALKQRTLAPRPRG